MVKVRKIPTRHDSPRFFQIVQQRNLGKVKSLRLEMVKWPVRRKASVASPKTDGGANLAESIRSVLGLTVGLGK
ncbi:MAG: hypothetical protein IJR99_09695 [Kiritimatiellae bacterium]|nr:hypothetical protein [Kiritimatiellia bacterium]